MNWRMFTNFKNSSACTDFGLKEKFDYQQKLSNYQQYQQIRLKEKEAFKEFFKFLGWLCLFGLIFIPIVGPVVLVLFLAHILSKK